MFDAKPALTLIAAAAALALTGCGAADSQPNAPAAATSSGDAAHPVVVELFQSQGCSSCPPANANLNAIADRADVLALSFAVTYWDQLGWKDSFASPAFTARQWDYAHGAGRANVATPQVIVNGGPTVVGSNRAQLDALIARQGPARGGPAIEAANGQVRVGGGAPQGVVWFVRYDPRVRAVPIGAGENGGRTLPHRDIVRQLVRLGDYNGTAVAWPMPAANEPGLAAAVLVQQGKGGLIEAARKL